MKAKSCRSSANRALRSLAVALYLTTCTVQAAPFTAYIDWFYIERSGAQFFSDTFSDGNPPPSVPIPPNAGFSSYGVTGSFAGGESGGKLRIGGNGYAASNTALGEPRLLNAATLATNTDSANTTNGLKRNFAFDVFGLFDYVTPALFDSYGLRLTDGGNDDVLDLRVAWSSTLSAPVVSFFRQDFVLGTFTLLEEALVPSSGFDQIVLALSHPDANSDVIKAGYLLVSGGNLGGQFTELATTTTIFHGELFTRAGFRAVTIPEPATLALLAVAFAGLGVARRRR